MAKLLGRMAAVTALMAMFSFFGGCSKGQDSKSGGINGAAQEPGKGGGPGRGGKGGPGGDQSPIHDIMVKLAKGPKSLGNAIGEELKASPPPWDKLQSQTKEYAELVGSLATLNPPKGSKESWAKLTGAFADSASNLNRAALIKDKDPALAAHKSLSQSCMACHQQHRGGPGGGGPGGPKGFGPPPGGPGFGPPPKKDDD